MVASPEEHANVVRAADHSLVRFVSQTKSISTTKVMHSSIPCGFGDVFCEVDRHPAAAPAAAALIGLVGVLATLIVTARSSARQLNEAERRAAADRQAINDRFDAAKADVESERQRQERDRRSAAKRVVSAAALMLLQVASELNGPNWSSAIASGRLASRIAIYERQFDEYGPATFITAEDANRFLDARVTINDAATLIDSLLGVGAEPARRTDVVAVSTSLQEKSATLSTTADLIKIG